jgi:hypothetical protein
MTLLGVDDFALTIAGAVAIEDDGLQMLLDAAEQAIVLRYGEPGTPVEEVHDPGFSYIFLRHPAVAPLTTVSERFGTTDTELDPDDYRLRDDRVSVLRLATGPNRGERWGLTTVTYERLDDDAERKRVQRALVMLDLDYAPGQTSEQIGAWMEQHAASSVWNYEKERAAILDSFTAALAPGFA